MLDEFQVLMSFGGTGISATSIDAYFQVKRRESIGRQMVFGALGRLTRKAIINMELVIHSAVCPGLYSGKKVGTLLGYQSRLREMTQQK